MKTRETTTPVRAFDRAYINGQFVTPHGTQIVDLVNPTDDELEAVQEPEAISRPTRYDEFRLTSA